MWLINFIWFQSGCIFVMVTKMKFHFKLQFGLILISWFSYRTKRKKTSLVWKSFFGNLVSFFFFNQSIKERKHLLIRMNVKSLLSRLVCYNQSEAMWFYKSHVVYASYDSVKTANSKHSLSTVLLSRTYTKNYAYASLLLHG